MNAPVQLAMPSWLAGRRAIQSQILERARTNLATLHRIAEAAPEHLHVLNTEAGWSAVLNLPSCVGEPHCAERLVRERGVVMHPGSFYGMAEPGRLVVSLIGPVDDFEASIQRAIVPISGNEAAPKLDELK
jgi:alanine-synthesizing transaminase